MVLDYTAVHDLLSLVDVQFRLKEFDNQEKWEDIKVSFTFPVRSPEEADRIAKDLMNKVTSIKEIRWNRAGNSQGHFVYGKSKYTRQYANYYNSRIR